ncbi:putative Ras-related protein Rab-24 [Operophtera brumata]|uniref:Putative Ras-related protein Rab-24 n=1 Tax=Operophtera brumata TaxID=104452 RepID=A0A0L7LCV2_OPEBR|nr:putative Ras-related protein Rab-24 [Operophtera brumata]
MSRCDLKIVLLGSEHVGKTSLVIRFVNSRYNPDIPYQNKDLLEGGFVTRQVPEDVVATYSQGLCGHFLTSSKTGENVGKI